MEILVHDEDSLTNLLFSEIHYHNKIEGFLNSIVWKGNKKKTFKPDTVKLHQQVNFSEFGKPDVLITFCDNKGNHHLVIIEAKLKRYSDACGYNKADNKFNNTINSHLNNQLTLRYRAIKAMQRLARTKHLTEIDHVPESPYFGDQIRRCKKPDTIKLLNKIRQNDFNFYLVVLTKDECSPFEELSKTDDFYPLFFDQEKNAMGNFRNLGFINWKTCNELFGKASNRFSTSFKNMFLKDNSHYEPIVVDKTELYSPRNQIVKYQNKVHLLTCKNYSYALRTFVDGEFKVVDRCINDREKYLSLGPHFQKVEVSPGINVSNTDEWLKYFKKKNWL